MNVERAVWVDWQMARPANLAGQRVYFGHETCGWLLPPAAAAMEWARSAADHGCSLTLVTPFLTDKILQETLRLIDGLLEIAADLEVVCSDWGLLDVLTRDQRATVVIGRALAARVSDPRQARMFSDEAGIREVVHTDGTRCRLKRRRLSETAMIQCRGCWLDKPAVIEWLTARGIRRAEVDNAVQGVEFSLVRGFSCSLHLPEVLVAVMRTCPGAGEDFSAAPACPSHRCLQPPVAWRLDGFKIPLERRQNALYYCQPDLPDHLPDSITRLVARMRNASR